MPFDLPQSTIHSMQTSGASLPPHWSVAAQPTSPHPPLSSKSASKAITGPMLPPIVMPSPQMSPIMPNKEPPPRRLMEEYQQDLQHLKEENAQLRYQKELAERDRNNVAFENNSLVQKLENLENIFVGAPIQKTGSENNTGSSHIASHEYETSKVFYYIFYTILAGDRKYGTEEKSYAIRRGKNQAEANAL